jgi:hypothetical protein
MGGGGRGTAFSFSSLLADPGRGDTHDLIQRSHSVEYRPAVPCLKWVEVTLAWISSIIAGSLQYWKSLGAQGGPGLAWDARPPHSPPHLLGLRAGQRPGLAWDAPPHTPHHPTTFPQPRVQKIYRPSSVVHNTSSICTGNTTFIWNTYVDSTFIRFCLQNPVQAGILTTISMFF